MDERKDERKDEHKPDVVTVGEAMALFIAREAKPLAQVRDFERATAGAEPVSYTHLTLPTTPYV